MNKKFEPIKFDSWQELAKYVIDGGEVYFAEFDETKEKIMFHDHRAFNCNINEISRYEVLYTKKQQTLEELIAIKPRLCWVWDNDLKRFAVVVLCGDYGEGFKFQDINGVRWKNAQMLTDDEIKQFLSDEG